MIFEKTEQDSTVVALRKESVDRNGLSYFYIIKITTSLSARRAWIEMQIRGPDIPIRGVALRKESVDRNVHGLPGHASDIASLSARRAWIEM